MSRTVEQIEDKAEAVKQINQLLNQGELSSLQKVEALLLQSRGYLSLGDFDNAIISSQKANDLASKTGLFAQQAKSNKLQGIIAYYQGNYVQSLSYYQASLKYYQSLSANQSKKNIAYVFKYECMCMHEADLSEKISDHRSEPSPQPFLKTESSIAFLPNTGTLRSVHLGLDTDAELAFSGGCTWNQSQLV